MATSRRNYLTIAELEEFADITVTEESEGLDQISQAEELVDAYVGPQQKFYPYVIEGKMSSVASATQFTLDSLHNTSYNFTDYFKGCIVEILGGPAIGERKRITASTSAGVITCEAFTTTPTTSSFYRIYQLGKYPRVKDVAWYSQVTPNEVYKMIPEAVKRAVAAQLQYMIEMGEKFFSTDSSQRTAESIGDYSYSKEAKGIDDLIAPKAKQFLRGYINRTGTIIRD